MPALNHALMIPGLIVVTLLFWAWIPVWALVRCLRRATKGPPSDEERLQTGHVPHRGYVPPPPEEVIEFLPPQDFADSAPLLSEKMQYDDAINHNAGAREKRWGRIGREDGIKTVEARLQKRNEEEERAAAVMKEQSRRHREERRERREAEEAERRREKGKGRVLSISEQSMMDLSSDITAPESVMARENSRRHHHSRR